MTLQNVADAAGVSVSTASRVLNGRAREFRISRRAEQLVRDAADRLNFRPSHLARSLRLSRSFLIGVVVPDVANPFFAAIAREVTVDAEAQGYSVVLADSRNQTRTEKRLVQQLVDRQVEGLVVCPVGVESDHLADIEASGLPLVIVDRGFADRDIVTVTSDHLAGAQAVAKLLLAHGHRHVGALQGLPGTLPNEQRLQGLRDALAACGLRLPDDHVAGDNFTEESGYAAATALLADHPQITALFALATPNALGGLRAAAELGRRVPDDLSIVTFDDHPFADFMTVPLTTASQNVAELGRTTAKLIIEQITSGKRPSTRTFTVPVTIIQRKSIHDAAPPHA